MIYLALSAFAVSILMAFGNKKGCLIGSKEEWSDNCDLKVGQKMFNGRKTFYIFWLPIYQTGFYHSTMLLD